MKYLLLGGALLGLGSLIRLYRGYRFRPVVPKWSHFPAPVKGPGRVFDGDRWHGEDDAA